MKTYPIQFSPPMVQRLLDGSKTRTRRTVTSMWANLKMHHEMGTPCYLWTQEGFAYYGMNAGHIFYRATDSGNLRWRPSIHMPRWASRLTLEVTDVRLQRLQEISHEDVLAEGVTADQVYDSVKAQKRLLRRRGIPKWIPEPLGISPRRRHMGGQPRSHRPNLPRPPLQRG